MQAESKDFLRKDSKTRDNNSQNYSFSLLSLF